MQFNEYQKLAGETDLEHPLNYYFLGLTEEAGEVAGLRKRFLRDEGNIDYDKMTTTICLVALIEVTFTFDAFYDKNCRH